MEARIEQWSAARPGRAGPRLVTHAPVPDSSATFAPWATIRPSFRCTAWLGTSPGVERWWFPQNFERLDVPFLFETADNPDLDPPADADFFADLEAWRAECEISRQIVAAHDLDDTARQLDWDEEVDLRWLVLRMITEDVALCQVLRCRGRCPGQARLFLWTRLEAHSGR
jgi:Protein of unknown function (DUF664)